MWDPVWEEIFRDYAWGKYPGEDLIRFVAHNFYKAPDRSHVRILEIGCGPGANLWYLAREGFSFAGIDGSSTAVEQAAQRLDAECPGWHDRGELHQGDISHLRFPDNSFDAVIDNEAVYCNDINISVAIYAEARRVLRKGGALFVRTFATGTWGDGTGEYAGHNAWRCQEGPLAGLGFGRFTDYEEIQNLLAGFNILSTELITRTMGKRQHVIKEWIINAEKPA